MTDAQIEEAFQHFCGYFERPNPAVFFELWMDILDGLEFNGKIQTWRGGGICCVDLVKCPTCDEWKNFVKGPDKKLVYGCFKTQSWLQQQVVLHGPTVLIFSQGLFRYYPDNCELNRDTILRKLWPEAIKDTCDGIWTFGSPTRLSIGLGSNGKIRPAKMQVRDAIQLVVSEWECSQDRRDE